MKKFTFLFLSLYMISTLMFAQREAEEAESLPFIHINDSANVGEMDLKNLKITPLLLQYLLMLVL